MGNEAARTLLGSQRDVGLDECVPVDFASSASQSGESGNDELLNCFIDTVFIMHYSQIGFPLCMGHRLSPTDRHSPHNGRTAFALVLNLTSVLIVDIIPILHVILMRVIASAIVKINKLRQKL